MARGDKSKYTEKQKRQAEHIEEGYESRGTSAAEAERRAWATVNAMTHGGKKPGGAGGGKLGGAASASRSKAERSASARKAARTRKRNAAR